MIVMIPLIIVSLIMVILFGINAYQAGRNWFGWALASAAIECIVTAAVTLMVAMFKPLGDSTREVFLFNGLCSLIAIFIATAIGNGIFEKVFWK
jgi:hypothetical protein